MKTMWFAKYAKGNNINQYSGFEHTFVGKICYGYRHSFRLGSLFFFFFLVQEPPKKRKFGN